MLDVLLVRAGALGDLLLLRPAIALLRAAGHRVRLLAPEVPGRVLLGPDAACCVLASDGAELAAALASGFGDGPIGRALAEADAVVAFTRSDALLARLRERARLLLPHDPRPPARGVHAARWLAGAVSPLVSAGQPAATCLSDVRPLAFTEPEQREAAARVGSLPARFVAVHPGSGSASKNWPLDRFLDAARRLAGGQRFLLIAGPAEPDLSPPEAALLARDWPVRVLGAALARAGLYLGNDAGVSHLASAAGAPTLALFGPTDPGTWAPIGPRVATLRAPAATLAELDVDSVVGEAERLRSAASGLPSG